MEPLTEQFHQAMLTTYHTAKNKHGYNATYFMQMISEFGGWKRRTGSWPAPPRRPV